jgi:hypothetical protein
MKHNFQVNDHVVYYKANRSGAIWQVLSAVVIRVSRKRVVISTAIGKQYVKPSNIRLSPETWNMHL